MSDHAPELEWPAHERPWGGVKDILYGSVRRSFTRILSNNCSLAPLAHRLQVRPEQHSDSTARIPG